MKKIAASARKSVQRKHWWKWLAGIIGGVFLFFLVTVLGALWYVDTHQADVRKAILAQLNENLNGSLVIGDIVPEVFASFPNLSLRLENVVLTDHRFAQHHKELLRAGKVEIAVNATALLRGAIQISRVDISDASVYLLTDASGYSNTSVFKAKRKAQGGSSEFPELRKFSLVHTTFTADNRLRNKLFIYRIDRLKGNITDTGNGWQADASLQAFAKSMSFSLVHGSFMENRALDGYFEVVYHKDKKELILAPNPLVIGGERFNVGAKFTFRGKSAPFRIRIDNEAILWNKASGLLSANIRRKLDMFAIRNPIRVNCLLAGDLESAGDPEIRVTAKCAQNEVRTPGGNFTDCSFDGYFTNTNYANKPSGDPNSAIVIKNFKGDYGSVPIRLPEFRIDNLERPMARGLLHADFPVSRLNGVVDKELLDFHSGTASVRLSFLADVNEFRIVRPLFRGSAVVKDGVMSYSDRQLRCNDIQAKLLFTQDELLLERLNMKMGHSDLEVQGRIANFLKLYYSNPEMIRAEIDLASNQLHISELLPFLQSGHKKRNRVKKTGNFTTELSEFLDKSQLAFRMDLRKLSYEKFTATSVRIAGDLLNESVVLHQVRLNNSGGTANLSGKLWRGGHFNDFRFNASVMGVDVRQFFREFDNFQMASIKPENLSGRFFLTADIASKLHGANGKLHPNSLNGKVRFTLRDGHLYRFDPIRNIGKYAFPHRDLNSIDFRELNGAFTLVGNKVHLEPLRVSSSVLNLDVAGIYSFGKGTDLSIDVPLRDPKRDEGITDRDKLSKRRHRGIVLHLAAQDDPQTGKVKIKLKRKDREKDESENP